MLPGVHQHSYTQTICHAHNAVLEKYPQSIYRLYMLALGPFDLSPRHTDSHKIHHSNSFTWVDVWSAVLDDVVPLRAAARRRKEGLPVVGQDKIRKRVGEVKIRIFFHASGLQYDAGASAGQRHSDLKHPDIQAAEGDMSTGQPHRRRQALPNLFGAGPYTMPYSLICWHNGILSGRIPNIDTLALFAAALPHAFTIRRIPTPSPPPPPPT